MTIWAFPCVLWIWPRVRLVVHLMSFLLISWYENENVTLKIEAKRQTWGQKQLWCLERKWKPGIVPASARFSFLPKQNKTTLCDRWLRVSENTLLLELNPLCILTFQGNPIFTLGCLFFFGFFLRAIKYLTASLWDVLLHPKVSIYPHKASIYPPKVSVYPQKLAPQLHARVNLKLTFVIKLQQEYVSKQKAGWKAKKAGNIRGTRLNSLRRLGILREKQRIQQMPLHTLCGVPLVYANNKTAQKLIICKVTQWWITTRLEIYLLWLVIGSQKWKLNLNPRMSVSVFLLHVASEQRKV